MTCPQCGEEGTQVGCLTYCLNIDCDQKLIKASPEGEKGREG